jgi:excisionase family DNA binding protein
VFGAAVFWFPIQSFSDSRKGDATMLKPTRPSAAPLQMSPHTVHDCACCNCRLTAALGRLEARLSMLTPPAPSQNGGPATIAEAAKALGCSQEHIRRLIRAGKLPAQRFGKLIRIPRTALAQ